MVGIFTDIPKTRPCVITLLNSPKTVFVTGAFKTVHLLMNDNNDKCYHNHNYDNAIVVGTGTVSIHNACFGVKRYTDGIQPCGICTAIGSQQCKSPSHSANRPSRVINTCTSSHE